MKSCVRGQALTEQLVFAAILSMVAVVGVAIYLTTKASSLTGISQLASEISKARSLASGGGATLVIAAASHGDTATITSGTGTVLDQTPLDASYAFGSGAATSITFTIRRDGVATASAGTCPLSIQMNGDATSEEVVCDPLSVSP